MLATAMVSGGEQIEQLRARSTGAGRSRQASVLARCPIGIEQRRGVYVRL
jgi:hypothetical protein